MSDEDASFAVLGAIALQGIRLLKPELGEQVVVFGLGLVGLLTVQMLVASGVRTIGIDLDPGRLQLAEACGATVINPADGTDAVSAAMALSDGRGVDGVLITASAKHDTIISQAAQMSRKRGRLVLVGVVNMELNRAEFYEKELTFQVSCSYGPGRYDPRYEQQGIDYPLPFVRWTEQRNIQAVLDLMAQDRLQVQPLISHRIDHADAVKAYQLLSSGQAQLGVVLQYTARAGTAGARRDVSVPRDGAGLRSEPSGCRRHDWSGRIQQGSVAAGPGQDRGDARVGRQRRRRVGCPRGAQIRLP